VAPHGNCHVISDKRQGKRGQPGHPYTGVAAAAGMASYTGARNLRAVQSNPSRPAPPGAVVGLGVGWGLQGSLPGPAHLGPICGKKRRYLRVCRYIASRLPEVRGRACAGAASASYASCRSGSIYMKSVPKSSPRTNWNEVLTELGPENQNWRYAVSSHRADE
jgi:hypothetical protein